MARTIECKSSDRQAWDEIAIALNEDAEEIAPPNVDVSLIRVKPGSSVWEMVSSFDEQSLDEMEAAIIEGAENIVPRACE